MASASLIGFFLVFVLVTWTLSVVTSLVFRGLRSSLRKRGAAAEKRASALAVLAPAIVGLLVSCSLLVYSARPALFGGVDHCEAHGSHFHLCLVHGREWAQSMWACALAAGLAAFFIARAARVLSTILAGHARLRIIQASSRKSMRLGTRIFLSPSQKDFCFAAGYWRSRIFVSTALWQRLDDAQKDAIIAHELAHIANRDLSKSLVLSLAEVVGAPLFARQAREGWAQATERLCDRIAADRIGDEAAVAEALLAWARGASPSPAIGLAFSANKAAIEDRVLAVLQEDKVGDRFAARLAGASTSFFAAVAVTTLVLADPVHHLFETLFGHGAGLF